MCVVAFDDLVSNADRYDGEVVSTVAYLTVNDQTATLYARREDYLSGVGDLRAVRFRQKAEDLKRTLAKHGHLYVFVHGRSHADEEGRRGQRVGNIVVYRFGQYLIEDRPEFLESLAVPVEELQAGRLHPGSVRQPGRSMMKKGLSLACFLAAAGIGQAAALSIGDRPLQEIYTASSMVAVVSATALRARCDSPGCGAAVYQTDLSIHSVMKGSAEAAGTTVEVCSVEPIALGKTYTVFIQKTPSWTDLARAECPAWVLSDGVFEDRDGTFYRVGSPDGARLAGSRGEIFMTDAVRVEGFPIMLQQLAETPVGPYAGCDATVADGIVRTGMAGISAATDGDARERAYESLGARISVMDKASLDCVTDESILALAGLWPVQSRSEGAWAAITMRMLGCRAAIHLPVLEAALAGAEEEDERRPGIVPIDGYGYVRELRWAIDVMQYCGTDAGAVSGGSAAKDIAQERIPETIGNAR